jgi:hypothetical protein
MGWTYHEKPNNVSEWLNNYLTYESDGRKSTCLKTAIKFKEAYAAVEVVDNNTGERYVYASVFLLNYTKETYYNFGYKTMSEFCGPNASNCPASILNLLTPVEDMPVSHSEKEWATAWRERCQKNAENTKINFGDKIEFENNLYGVHESTGKVFEKVRYGRKRNVFRSVADGTMFTLTRNYLNSNEFKVL